MNQVPFLVDITIGKNIRARRIEAGMSMETLGDKVGLTPQQISKYELGKHRIYASKLFEIAGALGVQIAYFFEGVEEIGGDEISREWLEVAKIYVRIKDERTRKRFRDLARAMIRTE